MLRESPPGKGELYRKMWGLRMACLGSDAALGLGWCGCLLIHWGHSAAGWSAAACGLVAMAAGRWASMSCGNPIG